MGSMGNHEFHPLSLEVFLDEIVDAPAPLEDEHEKLLVVGGSGVHDANWLRLQWWHC